MSQNGAPACAEGAAAHTPPPVPASLPRLTRYGRYVLVDRLGAGGMAEVFRAVMLGPEQFQRVMVVKRILPHLTDNASFVKMFIDEATLCGRLSHPNVIQVHEFGKQDGSYFIAMEYVEGRTLSAILQRLAGKGGHMPVNVAADIARQACLGLGYAHALKGPDGRPLGIIHRDVTPSNVMVAWSGQVKVLDFGIARVANEARISSTDAGQVKGKSSYLAPEALGKGAIDGRVDIFSIGIVLHEALTGRRLFKGSSPLGTMKLIQDMEIPRPSRHNPAVPARLDDIVMRALERKVGERWQTAEEMAAALESYLIERRYSSQDLPRFVQSLFEGEVDAPLSIPQEELRALMSASPPVPANASTKDGDGKPASPGEDAAEEIFFEEGSGEPSLMEFGDVEEAMASARKRRVLIGAGAAGAVLVLLAIVIGMVRSRPEDRPPEPPVATTAPASSPAPAAPAPVPAPAPDPTAAPAPAPAPAAAATPPPPPPLPKTVSISLTSEPAGAEVRRDAQVLGVTPVSLTLPRGSTAVELRLAKEGFVPGLLKIVPDVDKPAVVTLAKVVVPPPAPPAPPPPPPKPAAPPLQPRLEAEAAAATPATPKPAPRPRKQGNVRNAVPIDPFAQ